MAHARVKAHATRRGKPKPRKMRKGGMLPKPKKSARG